MCMIELGDYLEAKGMQNVIGYNKGGTAEAQEETALAQERRPILASAIKRALMVTAQPTEGATFVDEGTGLPDAERARVEQELVALEARLN